MPTEISEAEDKGPTELEPDNIQDNTVDDNWGDDLADAEEAAAAYVHPPEEDDEQDKGNAGEHEIKDPRDDIEESIMDARYSDENQLEEGQEEVEDEPNPDQDLPAKEDDPDPVFKAKIAGSEVDVPLSKLLEVYQKDGTADQKLQQASELLKQVKETTAAPQPEPTAEPAPEPSGDGSTSDAEDPELDAKLASIAEQVSVGDPADQVAALKNFMGEVLKNAPQPTAPSESDIQQQADAAAARAEQSRAITRDVIAFDKENPELNENPRLQVLIKNELSDVMKNDIKTSLKADGSFTNQQIAEVDTLDEEVITNLHRDMRSNGKIKSGTKEVLDRAKTRLVDAKMWPVSASGSQRSARKRGAQQQPGPRSRAPTTQQPSQRPREQTKAEAIAEEARARGAPG